jgi:hypothetical protein
MKQKEGNSSSKERISPLKPWIRRENLLALSLITPLQQSNSKVYFW